MARGWQLIVPDPFPIPFGLLIFETGKQYPICMDGQIPLVLLAIQDQGILGSFADYGALMASVVWAIVTALVLVRQLILAMILGDSG